MNRSRPLLQMLRERSDFEENTVKTSNCYLYYFRVGRGSHHVVFIPGAFGTWSDYTPQVEGLDLDQFTIICYDTPGFGNSRPYKRNFAEEFHHADADVVKRLMKMLDIPRYSVLGWSYGGSVALIHAALAAGAVRSLVVWGAVAHIRDDDPYQNLLKLPKDIVTIIQKRANDLGEQSDIIKNIVQGYTRKYKQQGGDICSDLLKYITCPTLVLHGAEDTMVTNLHARHLSSQIRNSRLFIYEGGSHHIHIEFAKDFNRRIVEFLLDSETINPKSLL